MSKNWGKKFHFEQIADEIELADFRYADLIVGNAEPMKDELMQRGVDENKILIVPNGVDPIRFSPSIDGTNIREKYKISEEEILVTFVGTFGPWHGTEVLAKTIKEVCSTNKNIKYMFVGNGANYNLVLDIVNQSGFSDKVIFTGLIPQLETPEYLAASDILVSPQIPNPDGTPFFGSPTKLFEYMAMGKAIVASSLDQMSYLLSNNDTALLTEPASITDLTYAILKLSKDKSLRQKLGANARNVVLEKYTWDKHVEIILEKLETIY
jgi:glycosyltransferase involved in cell wall biosynthesis